MPIFDYRCRACGNVFEELVYPDFDGTMLKKADDGLVPVSCPECSTIEVDRLLGSPMFDFRGTGFYVNDYKPPKPKNGQGDK